MNANGHIRDDEQSPLIPKPSGEEYGSDHETQSWIRSIASELWILTKGSIPVILAYALQNSIQTLSVLIVGRLSPEALSVAAFCYMWAMVCRLLEELKDEDQSFRSFSVATSQSDKTDH